MMLSQIVVVLLSCFCQCQVPPGPVDFKVREDLAERLLQNLEPSDWSAMVTRLAEKKEVHLPRFDP